jgi:hypothetical protein
MIHLALWVAAALFLLWVGVYAIGISFEMLSSGIGSFFLAVIAGLGGLFVPIPWLSLVCFGLAGIAALRVVYSVASEIWTSLTERPKEAGRSSPLPPPSSPPDEAPPPNLSA